MSNIIGNKIHVISFNSSILDRSTVEEQREEEIKREVWKLRSGKASGVCGIQGKVLRAGGEILVKWLQKIYNMVWRAEVATLDWRSAIIVPIHKKGSRKMCKTTGELAW